MSCSVYKVVTLRAGGGSSVARMMGGRLIQSGTSDPIERKIMNVVEEMALASGTPVPPVYLMDNEKGINAFAAGYAPESAVIGITRGAVEQLSRDELQGVVAHEFSHIFNGDMRLNIRLIGVIFGLIAIAVIGRVLFHSALYSGSARRRNDDKSGMALLVFGLALMAIGGLGVLFGQLIQAAVSRQREYLADASAVQFTRNPDSIGGALKRIGGFSSHVSDGHAGEISHMFIANAASSWIGGPFATHPPIHERIKRIDPSWDGKFPEPIEPKRNKSEVKNKSQRSPFPLGGDADNPLGGILGGAIGVAAMAEVGGGSQAAPPPSSAIDDIGSIRPSHVAYMRELLASIPPMFKKAAHEPYGARAVVYMLLLDTNSEVRDKQLEHLTLHADTPVVELTRKFAGLSKELAKEARLPLIDMAVPALREMSDNQYAAFKKNVEAMIKADGRVDLFEWALERLLLRHLNAHFSPKPDPKPKYYSLKPVILQCSTLLSVLSHVGNRDENQAAQAFASGRKALGLDGLAMMTRKQVRLDAVGDALDELSHVGPREKKKLIEACALAIAADGEVTRGEGELMRAVADSLGVPMPPMLPGQKLV